MTKITKEKNDNNQTKLSNKKFNNKSNSLINIIKLIISILPLFIIFIFSEFYFVESKRKFKENNTKEEKQISNDESSLKKNISTENKLENDDNKEKDNNPKTLNETSANPDKPLKKFVYKIINLLKIFFNAIFSLFAKPFKSAVDFVIRLLVKHNWLVYPISFFILLFTYEDNSTKSPVQIITALLFAFLTIIVYIAANNTKNHPLGTFLSIVPLEVAVAVTSYASFGINYFQIPLSVKITNFSQAVSVISVMFSIISYQDKETEPASKVSETKN